MKGEKIDGEKKTSLPCARCLVRLDGSCIPHILTANDDGSACFCNGSGMKSSELLLIDISNVRYMEIHYKIHRKTIAKHPEVTIVRVNLRILPRVLRPSLS